MTQTIESFVEKLHADGVKAGQQQADKLKAEAEAQAEKIIADAEQKAKSIVADAEAEAKKISDRERSELDLAIRDKMLAFRESMSKAVEAVLQYESSQALGDPAFLTQLIHDAVVNYAKDDADGKDQIEIRVNDDSMKAVTDWALKYIAEGGHARAHVDIKGTLKGIGFEYQASESTVEVTLESVVEALGRQVSPQLREVMDRVLKA